MYLLRGGTLQRPEQAKKVNILRISSILVKKDYFAALSDKISEVVTSALKSTKRLKLSRKKLTLTCVGQVIKLISTKSVKQSSGIPSSSQRKSAFRR